MDLSSWSRQIGVIEQMLLDRGCTNIFAVGTGVDPVHLCSCTDERGESMSVYLTDELKVGVKSVRKLRDDSKRTDTRHLLLGSLEGLTPFAAKELKDIEAQSGELSVEIFRKAELSFGVPHHILVPPHQLLTSVERKALLERLGCRSNALPKLKDSDPVARYYRYPLGSVIRIDRKIGTLECEPYFRVVVQ
jgi:DNA-directed RNA polymerase I, II, and III subunit RPABC1